MITLVAGLMVLAPFVVLALRTTRWDPIERRRRTFAYPGDTGSVADGRLDDLRRASTDLAAASAHAAADARSAGERAAQASPG